jgi:small subunit ribosomal protein S9
MAEKKQAKTIKKEVVKEEKTLRQAQGKPKEVEKPILVEKPAPVLVPKPVVLKPVEKNDEENELTALDFVISEKDLKSERYYEAIGRRKTAVARVRFYTRGEKQFLVNNKPYQEYFSHPEYQEIAVASLNKMKCLDKFRILVKVSGGGPHAQAEAIRHGTARVLVNFNPNFRKRLRKAGYITRDPRMRERKKFGLKRARRAPQWAKR